MENIIFNDETMIGYVWDIKRYIENEQPKDEDEKQIFNELLADLEQHDELVICYFHPMGSYIVNDLIEKE